MMQLQQEQAELVQKSVELVQLKLAELALGHTAAQRYEIAEQGSDLDAFVEIGKH
jgi:hypothetical protein